MSDEANNVIVFTPRTTKVIKRNTVDKSVKEEKKVVFTMNIYDDGSAKSHWNTPSYHWLYQHIIHSLVSIMKEDRKENGTNIVEFEEMVEIYNEAE